MQTLNLTNFVFAALILIWVIRQQLAPHVVRFKIRTYLIIILVGALSVNDAFTKHQLTITPTQLIYFGLASLLSAALFGSLRAWSYHFWVNENGLVMRQGNWLTIVLWIVGIATHLMVDRLWTGSSTTTLLYLGLTLLIQRGGVWWFARRNYPNELQLNLAAQTKQSHRRSRQNH